MPLNHHKLDSTVPELATTSTNRLKTSKIFLETSQNVSTSPNCSKFRSNHQKSSSNGLKLLRLVSQRHTAPPIASLRHTFNPNQSKLSQNCSYSFPVFRISSKTSTNCFQSPQNFRISFQDFVKLFSVFLLGHKFITICPKSSPNPTKCLIHHSYVPKSTLITAKWSQITKNVPFLQSPTFKTGRHLLSEISQHISSLINYLSSLL